MPTITPFGINALRYFFGDPCKNPYSLLYIDGPVFVISSKRL